MCGSYNIGKRSDDIVESLKFVEVIGATEVSRFKFSITDPEMITNMLYVYRVPRKCDYRQDGILWFPVTIE